ncbi:unnamed protein product [Dibothriocephalus latus]|uniref:Uncharacterized protein n=1 Tax=Dibothriocephalus latus TaxID=60516 RepID=A0A3P7PMY2_DIBLA|nr:unnamed protein product [Dibothriocephalus latus]
MTRARSRNDASFRRLGKLTAKSARDDRQKYWSETATFMERALNVVSGKPPTLGDSVRDVNGGIIADNFAKADGWREHFEHLLNFDEQPITPSLSSTAEFQPSPSYAVSYDLPSEDLYRHPGASAS